MTDNNTNHNNGSNTMKQVIGQLAIFGGLLVGAIWITQSNDPPPMTIDIPVDVQIGEAAVEEPARFSGQASRTLAAPGGVIEGWFR